MPTKEEVQSGIAHNVRTIARSKGVTMKALAKHMGWSEPMLYDRLNGDTKLGVHELAGLAEKLECSAADLFGDPDTLLKLTSPWIDDLAVLAA